MGRSGALAISHSIVEAHATLTCEVMSWMESPRYSEHPVIDSAALLLSLTNGVIF
jgi:hypothetical protein